MNNAHILGTERIGKLLVQYSIPAIIGMKWESSIWVWMILKAG